MKNIIKEMLRIHREKKEKQAGDKAWIELSNLYLDVQAKRVQMTRTVYYQLNDLLGKAYDNRDGMYSWWVHEFYKLPGWLEV